MIELHTLRPSQRRNRTKRVGRGDASGKGTTAGRGTKGQRARTGGRNKLLRRSLKRLVERTPKVRGFQSRRPVVVAITLKQLDAKFPDGATINAAALRQAGMIPTVKTRVKVLGQSKLAKKWTVTVPTSKSAQASLEAAGSKVRRPAPSPEPKK